MTTANRNCFSRVPAWLRPMKSAIENHEAKENPCRSQVLVHSSSARRDFRLQAVPCNSRGAAEQTQHIPPCAEEGEYSPALCWLDKCKQELAIGPLQKTHARIFQLDGKAENQGLNLAHNLPFNFFCTRTEDFGLSLAAEK